MNQRIDTSGDMEVEPTGQPMWAAQVIGGIALYVVGVVAYRVAMSFPDTVALPMIGGVGVVLILMHRPSRWTPPEGVSVSLPRLSAPAAGALVAYAGVVIGLLICLIALIDAAGGSPAEMFIRPDSEPRIARFVAAILVGPILEEFAFRGRIQGAVQARYGATIGIGVGALLFGFAHGLVAIGAVAMGIMFGLGMNAAGTVWAAVALHGIANSRAAVLGVWGLENVQGWLTSTWVVYSAAGLLVVGLPILLYFGRRLHVTIGWGAHQVQNRAAPT